ncbi:Permease of the drug/metabolite transporter (DMT) superfamily [Olavius algarvensis Delta 1 endosymbiont]|nr:Permease of the drug/metabolite transporter (DMT) superfamily [Olavius algarvensis Delta 1 endosymbiont]
MSALAILLVLLSALFHALRSLFTKESGDKQVFLWLYSLVALLFFLPLFTYFLLRVGITHPAAYAWCAGSGFIHFLYWLFLTQAYKQGDLSHVYPIMRSSPALVLLVAVLFLGEQVSVQGAAGILLVAGGVYIINMKHISGAELLAPVKAIVNDRATRFAFLTLISVAGYSIVDKMAVDYIHPILFAFFHLFCGMCYYTPYIALTKRTDMIRSEWQQGRGRIIMAGVIGITGYSMILIAFTIERVSYIVALRQLSVVFAVLMGSFWLKEKHAGIRLSGAVIIFSGCFLISMAT